MLYEIKKGLKASAVLLFKQVGANKMSRMLRSSSGNGSMFGAAFLMLVLAGFMVFELGPSTVQEQVQGLSVKLEDGLEMIKTKTYPICYGVSWSEIKAAGIHATSVSLDGFLQLCQRFAVDVGSLKVYADVEFRVLWVYCPTQDATGVDAYYVQFT